MFFDDFDACFDWEYIPSRDISSRGYVVYKRTFGMNGRKKQSGEEV